MRPARFEAQLHEVLDRRERPEECAELRALANRSPECRELLAAQQRLFEGLEADEIPEVSAGFAERVVSQLAAFEPALERAAARRWRSAWVVELAAVAALALVVIAGSSYFSPATDNQRSVAELPKEETAPPEPLARVAEREKVDEEQRSPAPAVDAIVQEEAAAPASDAASERYDELYQAILERLPNRSQPDELLALRPQWVDEMALGLRPIAASFGGAINTLRSTLPPNSKSERPEKPQAGVFDGEQQAGIA